MSELKDYTQDEVEKLMAAPILVSMYVMGSALSGPIGLVKEMMAGVDTAVKAAKEAAPDSILHSLFSEANMKAQQDKMQQETKESTAGAKNMDEAKAKMLADIKNTIGIISAKGSAVEVDAYKQLVVQVADNVAHAAKEGGFMGMGGTLVNEAEKTAIADIQNVVNAPPMPEPPAAISEPQAATSEPPAAMSESPAATSEPPAATPG